MSVQFKNLTELQTQIIDALANDFEDVERICEMVELDADRREIEAALWGLIEEGIVACYTPTKVEMRHVDTPDRPKLSAYWFALTEKGEQLLTALEA